jgi:hypothetical protein
MSSVKMTETEFSKESRKLRIRSCTVCILLILFLIFVVAMFVFGLGYGLKVPDNQISHPCIITNVTMNATNCCNVNTVNCVSCYGINATYTYIENGAYQNVSSYVKYSSADANSKLNQLLNYQESEKVFKCCILKNTLLKLGYCPRTVVLISVLTSVAGLLLISMIACIVLCCLYEDLDPDVCDCCT